MKTDMKTFLGEYGDTLVTFDNYYKYTFNYRGIASDGNIVCCGYGGDADDIYRHEVDANKEEKVKLLEPTWFAVYDKYHNVVMKDW